MDSSPQISSRAAQFLGQRSSRHDCDPTNTVLCGKLKNQRGVYPHRCPLVLHRGQARKCPSWPTDRCANGGKSSADLRPPRGAREEPSTQAPQASDGAWRGTYRKGVVTSRPPAPPRSQGTTPVSWNPVGDARARTNRVTCLASMAQGGPMTYVCGGRRGSPLPRPMAGRSVWV